jgi:hypothetical protein
MVPPGIPVRIPEDTSPGIYFLLRGGVVVYVGESLFPVKRIMDHRWEGLKDFDDARYIPAPKDKAERLRLEAEHILKYRPEYNGRIDGYFCRVERTLPVGVRVREVNGIRTYYVRGRVRGSGKARSWRVFDEKADRPGYPVKNAEDAKYVRDLLTSGAILPSSDRRLQETRIDDQKKRSERISRRMKKAWQRKREATHQVSPAPAG